MKASRYQIVLTVHDELITEAPDSPEFNAEDLAARLAQVPDWAPGLPLAAGGFEAYRYRKD
jgi:DNA polymerase